MDWAVISVMTEDLDARHLVRTVTAFREVDRGLRRETSRMTCVTVASLSGSAEMTGPAQDWIRMVIATIARPGVVSFMFQFRFNSYRSQKLSRKFKKPPRSQTV